MEDQNNFETLPKETGTTPALFDHSVESGSGKTESKAAVVAGYLRLLLRIVLIALFCFLIFTKVFLVTGASGNEMFPAVKDGDLVLAFRLQGEYVKNDVVVYELECGKAIGRVAALEGDVVLLDDSGTLTVNGTLQSGEILFPTYAKGELVYPYKVPAGSVFLLGDHRPIAQDSREYGSISLKNVKGKVITVLRRRGI